MTVLEEQPLPLLALLHTCKRGKIDTPPGSYEIDSANDLHRSIQVLLLEGGAEVRMAAEQPSRSCCQQLLIDRAPLEHEGKLHRVEVGISFVIHGMEQQTFLQRRQWQNIL